MSNAVVELTPDLRGKFEQKYGKKIADLSDDQLRLEKFNAENSASVITCWDLLDKEFPEPTWAIPGIVPEGLTILAGNPKIGKSWLALNIGVAASLGGRVLGEIQVDKMPVLYLALEDSQRRLQTRLNMVGSLPSKDLYLETRWERGEEGLKKLVKWMKDYPQTRLIIIDTLARFRGISLANGNQYDPDYRAIAKIKEIADQFEISILLIHHTRKSASDDYVEEVSGTFGLTGAADTVLRLKRGRGRADAELSATGRDIEERDIALEFRNNIGWCILGDAKDYQQTKERQEIVEILKGATEPLGPKDIAPIVDKTAAAVQYLLMQLEKEGQVKKESYGKYRSIT